GAAVPAVRPAVRQVLLKPVVIREVEQRLARRYHLRQNEALPFDEGKQLAGAVMNDSHGGRKAKTPCAPRDDRGILGVPDPTADDRVHGDVELAILGQPPELLVESFQALLRPFVRYHVVDADLKVVEPGPVQSRDAIASEKISIGDEGRDHSAFTNAADDRFEIGMQ